MAMVSIKTLCFARKLLPEIHYRSKELVVIKSLCRRKHTLCYRTSSLVLQNKTTERLRTNFSPVITVASVRWASNGVETKSTLVPDETSSPLHGAELKTPIVLDEASLPPIPTPPAVVETGSVSSSETIADTAIDLTAEPSLASYGLGSWSPVGMVQQCLEYLHITLDLPWWGSIVVGTLVLRTLVFPLVILAQRNGAKMANNLPQLQRIQEKMTEARQSGNYFESSRMAQEMMIFMKEKKMNPITNALPPLAQAPLFISMFMGLRGMCNVPVESLREGGILWFVDLTVPDQYYLLPIITSLTLAITIEIGTDSARASTLGMMRYVFRAMPVVIFPFTMNFPGAILCYWVSTNFMSLIQVGILRIPKVRTYFKIEPLIQHNKADLPVNKGFVKGFKESMTNMKITRQLNDRLHVDSVNFQRAGRAPIQRTFKYDPTKVKPTTPELLAKKKEL